MTLVDAGPLISLLDKGQGDALSRCLKAQHSLTGPLLTTWPCLTESMYFLRDLRGWPGQDALWRLVTHGALVIHTSTAREIVRMRILMEQYQDVPMDLADASLVALAEANGLKRVFTLDRDFHTYRLNNKEAFEVFP